MDKPTFTLTQETNHPNSHLYKHKHTHPYTLEYTQEARGLSQYSVSLAPVRQATEQFAYWTPVPRTERCKEHRGC